MAPQSQGQRKNKSYFDDSIWSLQTAADVKHRWKCYCCQDYAAVLIISVGCHYQVVVTFEKNAGKKINLF